MFTSSFMLLHKAKLTRNNHDILFVSHLFNFVVWAWQCIIPLGSVHCSEGQDNFRTSRVLPTLVDKLVDRS